MLKLTAANVDLERQWVERADARERLTGLETEVLRFLARHSDRAVSRDELLAEVWGHGANVVSRACDNTIRRLRTKIEIDPAEPESLLTVHGVGYRLILASESAAPPAAEPAPPSTAQLRFTLGERTVDLDRARIETEGTTVALTANEIAVLRCLWEAGGLPVERDPLMRKIWGSAAGRAIENVVSRLRKKIEVDPTRPLRLLTTVNGYRLDTGRAPEDRPRAESDGNLPTEVDARFGRDTEIAAVTARFVAGDRIVTLVGPGGVGKTRLAVAAAQAVVDPRSAGWFVDLTEARTVDRMCAAIASVLGVVLADDPLPQLGRALAARGRVVVVLDNLEQLEPAAWSAVGSLAERASEAKFLCTSRVLLRIRGERRVEVHPLSVDDAAALFVDRAIRPPADHEAEEVRALVRELDGLPLAIELAAARTRILSVAELRRRIGERLRLLSQGDRDRPERYRSLQASLDGSWELLESDAQRALVQLSVFEGGFTLDAAERVVDLSGSTDAPWTVDVVQQLIDASLVRMDADGARMGILRTIRDYLAEKGEDLAGARARHAAWCADRFDLAALAALDGPQEIEARRALSAERDNLAAACHHACEAGDAPTAVATACAAWEALELSGPFRTGIALLDQALALPLAEVDRARARLCAGRARAAAGSWDEALEDLGAAAGLARELGDGAIEARAELERARILCDRGWLTDAMGVAQRALALTRSSTPGPGDPGQRALQCRAYDALAAVHLEQWRRDEALGCADEATALAAALGARRLSAMAGIRRGAVYNLLDAPEAARAELDAALQMARDVGDARLEAQALLQQGAMGRYRGRLDGAHVALEAAVALHRRTGDRRGEAEALCQLGANVTTTFRLDEAQQLYDRAVGFARELSAPSLVARGTMGLANVHALRGQAEAAASLYNATLTLARDLGDPRIEGVALVNYAKLHRDRGDLSAAKRLYEAGLSIHQRAGNRRAMAIAMGHMADLLEEQGRLDEAVETYEQAIALHHEIGNARWEANCIHNLGRTHILRSDFAAADPLLDDAIRRYRELADPVQVGRAWLTRAELELSRSAYPEAREAIAVALRSATPEQLAPRLEDLHEAATRETPPPRPEPAR